RISSKAMNRKPCANFRLFSRDENNSNRWQDVLEVTNRAWVAETYPWDDHLAPAGRVMRKRCPRPLPVGGRGPLIQSPMFGDGLEASFAKKIAVLFGERWRARRTAGGDRGPDGPAALA
ncbi:MAG TPA: hypothetical protein VFY19_01960, partial [Geminicoccaceae bacterium]|nr:hypothetical protein [Geminicoccaceae bacterium]